MVGDPNLSGNDVVAAPAIISVFVPKVVAQIEARIEGQRLEKVGFDTAHYDKTYAALISHASGAGRRLTDSTPLNTLDLSLARVHSSHIR